MDSSQKAGACTVDGPWEMLRLRSRTSLLALLVLVTVAQLVPAAAARAPRPRPGACAAAHVTVRHATMREARNATLCLLNRVRAADRLPPLRFNAKLTRVAGQHSRDMVRKRYFAHDSLNGRSPFARILAAHYVPHHSSWWLGENIGWGSGGLAQPIAMVRAWMHSPPHRANILSRRFRDIGIGIAAGAPVGGRGATYTTDFGSHS